MRVEKSCTVRLALVNYAPPNEKAAMSQYLDATVKNPRWWITLPFILGVMLPLLAVQLGLRLVAVLARAGDKGLETLGHAMHKPVHAWWRAEAVRRQGQLRLDADF